MKQTSKWFDLNNYKDDMSIEDWAYEIWVRANYYHHASFFSDAGFFVMSGKGPINKVFVWSAGGIPASKENYEAFLHDRNYFVDYFAKQVDMWSDEKEKPAINIYDSEDIFPSNTFSEFPDKFTKDEIESYISRWCDNAMPIGVNLEKTDEELLIAFKDYLKDCRHDQKEFFSLKRSVAVQLKEWHAFRLLALFDLLYWREAFDKSLTHSRIGAMVWPDSDIEIEQRVRKKGIPLIEKVFSIRTAKALWSEALKSV